MRVSDRPLYAHIWTYTNMSNLVFKRPSQPKRGRNPVAPMLVRTTPNETMRSG